MILEIMVVMAMVLDEMESGGDGHTETVKA